MVTPRESRALCSPFLFAGLLALAGASCRNATPSSEGASETAVRAEQRSAATEQRQATILVAGENAAARRVLTFEGTCDASGAVELDERTLVVADDENNWLRVYDAERGGPPLQQFDVSLALGLEKPKKESDLEAATRAGDRAYFVASHGRNSKGKRDDNRLVFFATTLPLDGKPLEVVGAPYRSLLEDLVTDPKLAAFRLEEAALRAPKEPGGMNLEGMTSQPDGSVLLGFRSPIPGGDALLVRLLNPDGVIRGEKAELSAPISLDLGGLGVRALSSWAGGYLIAGGPSGDGGPFRLFHASYDHKVRPLAVELEGFGAEALFTPESGDQVLVLSDDGTRPVEGCPCKKLKDQSQKSFRGVWVRLPR